MLPLTPYLGATLHYWARCCCRLALRSVPDLRHDIGFRRRLPAIYCTVSWLLGEEKRRRGISGNARSVTCKRRKYTFTSAGWLGLLRSNVRYSKHPSDHMIMQPGSIDAPAILFSDTKNPIDRKERVLLKLRKRVGEPNSNIESGESPGERTEPDI